MVTIVSVHIIQCIIFVSRVSKSNEKLLISISIDFTRLNGRDCCEIDYNDYTFVSKWEYIECNSLIAEKSGEAATNFFFLFL